MYRILPTVPSSYRETEERAQKAEESEATKSAELVDALQRLRALERQMEEMQNTGDPTPKPTAEEPRYKTYFYLAQLLAGDKPIYILNMVLKRFSMEEHMLNCAKMFT